MRENSTPTRGDAPTLTLAGLFARIREYPDTLPVSVVMSDLDPTASGVVSWPLLDVHDPAADGYVDDALILVSSDPRAMEPDEQVLTVRELVDMLAPMMAAVSEPGRYGRYVIAGDASADYLNVTHVTLETDRVLIGTADDFDTRQW